MATAALGSLRVDLIANIARFNDAMTRAEQIANRRSRAIRTAIRSIGGAFAGISIGAAVGGTVRAFADYEKALVGVGKTTDLEGKALEDFGNQVREIGERIPIATNELLGLAESAGQLGISGTGDLLKFTETMAKLQLATDVAGAQGAASIARLLTVTGTAVSDVDKFANVLVDLGNSSAATESEILGVATRIGQATSAFDVSANQALAYGASLKSIGIEAEAAGSVMGRVFKTISLATGEAGDDLNTIADIAGVTAEEFQKLFGENQVAAVNKFLVGLGNVEGGANGLVKVLRDLGLSGQIPERVLLSIASASETVTKSFATMERGIENNNAATIEAAKYAKTFSAQMTLLGNRVNTAAVNIGKLVVPAVLTGMDALGKAAKFVADNIVLLKDAAIIAAAVIGGKLLVAIAGSNAVLAAWAIAAGNVNIALLLMQARLAIVTAATWALNAALAANPFVLAASAIAAIGAAILIYKNHTDDATVSTEEYSQALKDAENAGKSAAQQSYETAKARLAQRKETLKAKEAELELALAHEQFIMSRAPEVAPAYKNAAKAAGELKSKIQEAQFAIAATDEELINLTREADKSAAALNKVGASGSGAANGLSDIGAAAATATQDLSAMGQALDMISAQMDELETAEARKIAGVDDESFEARKRVSEAADRADPKRQLGRDIEQLKVDITYETDEESKRLAIESLGEMQEEYNNLSGGWKETSDEMSQFTIEAFRSMERATSDLFFNVMQGNFDNMADQFKSTIDRMVADYLASELLNIGKAAFASAGGGAGFTGFLSGLFKAKGGPVYSNHPYVVGEEGPELFVPSNAGNIIPNGGSVGGVTNINVTTPDVNSFRLSQRQIAIDSARLQGQARAMS